jgi:hypothetical protein
MAGRGARWCPGFVFAIIINENKIFPESVNWAPQDDDDLECEKSFLEMGEFIAR